MYRLIESIKVEAGSVQRIQFHSQRFNQAKKALFADNEFTDLGRVIQIPENMSPGVFKLRILFDGKNFEQELIPYTPKNVSTLKLIYDDQAAYPYKTENRQALDEAYALRGEADDIILVKDSLLTDSFSANLLLFDGTRWFTPSTPLLKGTQRAWLLQNGMIEEARISVDDLNHFSSLKLINAMIGFEEARTLPLTESIIY